MPFRLSPASRFLWAAINLTLGLLPSLAFFIWAERNLSLPYLPAEWGWPWVRLEDVGLIGTLAFDGGLFLAFGLLHSVLAQERFQERWFSGFPRQAWRTLYMAVTGLSLIAVMGLWQSTGQLVWAMPTSAFRNLVLSVVLFWGWMTLSLSVVRGFDALEFIGLRQLFRSNAEVNRPAGSPRLFSDGVYSWVRHPMYLFTMAAFVCAPLMTLDRLFLVCVMALYLAFAIPVEEKKLVRLFGRDYLEYRKRVPALIPYRIPRRIDSGEPTLS